MISPDAGFWKPHDLSEDIYECLFQGACLGGAESACFEGYEGLLCHECVYDESNQEMQFTRQKGHKCAKCPTKEKN